MGVEQANTEGGPAPTDCSGCSSSVCFRSVLLPVYPYVYYDNNILSLLHVIIFGLQVSPVNTLLLLDML